MSQLSLLAPRRVILLGPDSALLRAAIAWARESAGVTVLRVSDPAVARAHDLLVSEHLALLPLHTHASVLASESEGAVAVQRGWLPLAPAADGGILLAAPGAGRHGLAPRLQSYARTRLALSDRLERLGIAAREAGDSPAGAALEARSHRPVERVQIVSEPAPPRLLSSPVSIIVPVYNAAAELRRCLHALSRHTTWPAELVIVDDASPDAEVAEVLAEASLFDRVRVLANAANLGFTASVNRAVRATSGDVVVLNSDTEVGPRWLEHLVSAVRSQPGVASVTAVSDNAGAFSVPRHGEPNATPLSLDLAATARLISQAAPPRVATPTGSGFCMYITRRALDEVGPFDAEAFPRGYGEENDFCMRASRAGFVHLVDGRTFVHHVREASFGAEKSELTVPARRLIDRRYPEYTGLVRQFVRSGEMSRLRSRVATAYADGGTPRPRVLFLIHEGAGGTWVANLELVRMLEREWEPLVLTSDRRTLRLWRLEDGDTVQEREWTLGRSIRVMDFSRQDYRKVVRAALEEYEVELVHVRHLFKHTFDGPVVAASLGVPVVFSFHDFYFTCPTVNLLDDRDTYCAADCTPGDGVCRVPRAGLEGLPHLKHSFVYQWREEVEAMLQGVDAFVTTSVHARDIHLKALPSLSGRPFELIEHGRTLPQRGGIAVPPRPGGPIRILVVANLDVHKGANYIRALREADLDRRLEFHLLGSVPDEYAALGVRQGVFAAGELADRATAIGPAFIGCFSITPETYSHSLTEAWAMGVPVLATDLGAFGERIRGHGGGRLLPLNDPSEAVRRIYAAVDDPAAYQLLRERASLRGCATVDDMTDAYTALYRRVLDGRRTLAASGVAGAPSELRRGIVRMLAVVHGSGGIHPGSTYVRVLQRYRHPSVAPKIALDVRSSDDEPLARAADVVLVQRTALDPATTEDFIATRRERGTPLILELDDHLLIKGGDDPDYGSHQESLAALIDAAELVIVSTAALAAALADAARRLALVPNMIDERLFLSGVRARPRAAPERGDPLQLVYVGSPTHARDLALLRPVMEALQRTRPGLFELNVVGVESPGPGQEWYRRVVVPDECKPYPRFVRWLRQQRSGWHIGLAPLADDQFNRFKSDLKFLEYAALGLPAVLSDCEPYAAVEHERTALKCGEQASEWVAALSRLADDRALREDLAEGAFEQITSRRLMRHGSAELLTLICELAGADVGAPPPVREAALIEATTL
jgi:GT2 family glycosyltransferase/glycosyltransferase involved in cell wall biosynthesis